MARNWGLTPFAGKRGLPPLTPLTRFGEGGVVPVAVEQVERFVILKIYPHRVSIILNVGLIGRRIMAKHCFGSRIVDIFPVGIDVAS